MRTDSYTALVWIGDMSKAMRAVPRPKTSGGRVGHVFRY